MDMSKAIASISIAILISMWVLAGCSSNKAAQKLPVQEVTIFKTLSCGCCGVYSQYLGREGFKVSERNINSLESIRTQYKIPSQMLSCHTAVMGDYFIEGHVPFEAIEKLFLEKPDIAGIALPGMPPGSPGMSGRKAGVWTVYAVKHDGNFEKFMSI